MDLMPHAQVVGSKPTDIPLVLIRASLAQVMEEVNAVPKPKPAGPKVYAGEFLSDREEAAEADREEVEAFDELAAELGVNDGFRDDADQAPDGYSDGDAFAPETDGDFDARPVGEHSRQAPAGEATSRAKGRGRR